MTEGLSPYLPFLVFLSVMVATPGPANLLLINAGASHGFRENIPFLAGLILGKFFLNILVSVGLGTLVTHNTGVTLILSIVCTVYISYLALKAWNNDIDNEEKLPTYRCHEGIIVHMLSPKSWVMVTMAYSTFAVHFPDNPPVFAVVTGSFVVAQLLFHGLWCFLGTVLKRGMGYTKSLNRTLILLTIGAVIWAAIQTTNA
jgi:threonine/homoserine/homoserine lactone efflux protein